MKIWLIIATWLEWSVLGVLLVSSVWSVSIMIDRRRLLKQQESGGHGEEAKKMILARDWAQLKSWAQGQSSLIAGSLKAALETAGGDSEAVDRAVRSYLTEQRLKLEKGFAVLATLGSNAPFIGLFGTVLGIIRAFAALGESSGSANSVMSGISQALYATAAGLFVAIPAVVAFNHFSNKLRVRITECEALKDLYLAQRGK